MGKEVKAEGPRVTFVNRDCSAYSESYSVPAGSLIVLQPTDQQYKIYDADKLIMHEGDWTLNGQKMAAPTFIVPKEKVLQVKADGTVIIQGLGDGVFMESHLHRWQATNSKAIACVHVYGDGVKCPDFVLEPGLFFPAWGARSYVKGQK